jgi:secreted Zn-dependent insulinase-like peptidase
MLRLFVDLVGDSLNEFSYDADLAGLSYNYASHSFGTYLVIGGYNDKLPLLLQHIFEKIRGLEVQPERLCVMKEQVRIHVRLSGLWMTITSKAQTELGKLLLGPNISNFRVLWEVPLLREPLAVE